MSATSERLSALCQRPWFKLVWIAPVAIAVLLALVLGAQAFPVEAARALHFPLMIAFVAFIVVHLALVLATGALRNLNHMYAATDATNWTGFWIFLGSLGVMAGAWIALRPMSLRTIASTTGKVTRS